MSSGLIKPLEHARTVGQHLRLRRVITGNLLQAVSQYLVVLSAAIHEIQYIRTALIIPDLVLDRR